MEHVTCPHDDTLVITAKINGYGVKRVFIDSDSSTNVLFLYTLTKLEKSQDLKKVNFPLMGRLNHHLSGRSYNNASVFG